MTAHLLLASGGVATVAIGGSLVVAQRPVTYERFQGFDAVMARLKTKPTTTAPFPASGVRSIPLRLKPDAQGKEYQGVFVFAVPLHGGVASLKAGERGYDVRVAGTGERPTIDVGPGGRSSGGRGMALAPGRMKDGSGRWFDTYFARTTVPGPSGAALPIGFRLVPDAPPTVPQWAGKLVVAPQYAYLGRATFGGRTMLVGVASVGSGEDFLAVDRNGDGRAGETLAENYRLDGPFSLGGATYRARLAFHGGRPNLEVALTTERVAEVPLRSDLPPRAASLSSIPMAGVRETRPLDRYLPPARPTPPPVPDGSLAPDFAAYAPDGHAVSLGGLRGKVVVLDFWASWCGPCERWMPSLAAAHRKVEGQGAVVLGVNTWDAKPAFLRWVRENPRYGFEFVRDPAEGDASAIREASVARRLYRVGAIPTTFVIDRRGRVVGSLVGSGNEKGLVRLLRRAGLRL